METIGGYVITILDLLERIFENVHAIHTIHCHSSRIHVSSKNTSTFCIPNIIQLTQVHGEFNQKSGMTLPSKRYFQGYPKHYCCLYPIRFSKSFYSTRKFYLSTSIELKHWLREIDGKNELNEV